jgi:hypothetical protein
VIPFIMPPEMHGNPGKRLDLSDAMVFRPAGFHHPDAVIY